MNAQISPDNPHTNFCLTQNAEIEVQRIRIGAAPMHDDNEVSSFGSLH